LETPETRYAQSGDVHIAYQVVGDGPLDLVYVPTWISQVEHLWEERSVARFLERLASFSRLILFDRRGAGLSDPILTAATLEDQMDDVLAVMDAADSERAALVATLEGGAMATLFAATYPDRTSALALYATFARATRAEDYQLAWTAEEREAVQAKFFEGWGESERAAARAAAFAPSLAKDEQFLAWWARLERLAASPGTHRRIFALVGEHDVRDVLPTIRVPTLVMHRAGDQFLNPAHSRYLAEHIPGARYVELPGDDNLLVAGDSDAILGEIEEFLTGARHEREPDRVLATVMFTDIVGSTERASELGDSRWRDLLGRHDALVRRALERHRGREVKTVGDGFLATFDGPARAIRCASAISESVPELGLDIRAGLHTGECEVMNGDVGGMAVHIGARVAARAGPGEILVSSTVKDLVVGSGIEFADRGAHELKGVPGEWRLFAVA
jgi:class 3 adenylate cyclase